MGPDPAFEAVVDGADLEIDGLVAAERLPDPAQALAGPDGLFGREPVGGQIGAEDVDPVESVGDLRRVVGPGEALLGDGGLEVLADVVATECPVGASPCP